MLCHGMSYIDMLSGVMICHAVSHHGMLDDGMSWHVVSCYVRVRVVMPVYSIIG